MSRLYWLAALIVIAGALATASRLPLFDPDEGYYPATAAESLDRGPWWDLRFNGDARWEKPILAYALIEGAFVLFGRSPAVARLPSAIEGAALAVLCGLILSRLVSRQAGALTSLVLATTLGVQIFARAAHPEIAVVLSIAITEMLLIMWLVIPRSQRSRWWPVWAGVSLAYGLLAKGPVAVVVPLLGTLIAAPFVIDLRARWREAAGDAAIAGGIALALAAPWYIAMTLAHGVEFLRIAIWAQNIGRYAGQMADHGQSAGVFALAAAAGLLPWVGLLPAAVARVRNPRGSTREAVRFVLVVMAASSLAFYSASASKLASYSLALIPPLAALIALYLDDVLIDVRRGGAPAFRWAGAVLGVVATSMAILPLLHGTAFRMRDLTGGVPGAPNSAAIGWLVASLAIIFAAGAIAAFVLSARARIAALALTGMAAPLAALLVMAPILGDAYPWQRFGARITREPDRVWLQMYRAPSLTFFSGQTVTIVTEDELRDLLTGAGSGWVVLGADWAEQPALAARLAGGTAAVVDRSPRLILVKLH
ncbi:MAG TPA: glycosyltransferase family 39 protein [Vicinamibacterales bacterium]|nr:glycosyltransferase family 39 protein [Vicinamibacterales bacterium]